MADRSAIARRPSPAALAEASSPPNVPAASASAAGGVLGLPLDMVLRDGPPFCLTDPHGNVLYANVAYCRIGEPLLATGGWPAAPAGLTDIRAALAPGRDATDEMSFGFPERPFRAHYGGVFDADGALVGVGITLQEIAEDERLQQRARSLQTQLDDLTRLVSDWLWETDAALNVTFVSPRITDILGYDPREMTGRPFRSLGEFDAQEDAGGVAILDTTRRVPFRDAAFAMRHRDGTRRLFRVSGLPVFSPESGAFVGFRGTARDITAETEAREQQERSRNQLTEAVESVSEGFALFDADDRLVLCNRRFRAIYPRTPMHPGIPFADLVRGAVESGDILLPPAEREAWIEARMTMRADPRDHFEIRLGDGRWIQGSDRRTADGATVGIRTDITELKRREAALSAAKEEAEIASRSKSEFLANISHELRTPLNAIIGFTEIMHDEIFGPIGAPKYREYLADVLDSARHLLDLINDILDIAKAEAGKLQLDEETVDVRSVMVAATRLVHERAHRAKLALGIEVSADLPAIRGDERKLKQILLNLLTNAVKFTPAGGRITVAAALAPDGDLLLTVADTGIGIAAADIATALAPFGQVDGSLQRKYQGTGLGLPLSRAMVELHGGTLDIESTVGAGTTVTIRLPASRVLT
jgi:PAS domain S-box-containing protein